MVPLLTRAVELYGRGEPSVSVDGDGPRGPIGGGTGRPGTGGDGELRRGGKLGGRSGGPGGGAGEESLRSGKGGSGSGTERGMGGRPMMGGRGRGGQGEDDYEHETPDFLEGPGDDFWSPQEKTAPPVIGDWWGLYDPTKPDSYNPNRED